MAELTAHLTDHVPPHLPCAKWVLSVRPYLHHNPEVAGAALGIFLRAIRTALRRTSPGASSEAQLGAVSFLRPRRRLRPGSRWLRPRPRSWTGRRQPESSGSPSSILKLPSGAMHQRHAVVFNTEAHPLKPVS